MVAMVNRLLEAILIMATTELQTTPMEQVRVPMVSKLLGLDMISSSSSRHRNSQLHPHRLQLSKPMRVMTRVGPTVVGLRASMGVSNSMVVLTRVDKLV